MNVIACLCIGIYSGTMFRRAKEEDKIEMIIRGLMKEPENKRCINCNSLGPQYVCTTFWTFVCTNCSGVHRSFNHRVKSVSMARFNEEEIMALQAGGNERARQIYFKDWNPQKNQYPNSSNLHRLKEFVQSVYVDRKYVGSNHSYKDTENDSGDRRRLCWGSTEDFLEKPSFDRCNISSRDEFDRCPLERSSPSSSGKGRSFRDIFEARSPRELYKNSRSSRPRSKMAQFEIVDDRFRDDGIVKRYDRHSRKDSRTGSMSPSHGTGRSSSLPAVSPVKDFLGEKVNLSIDVNHKDVGWNEVGASTNVRKNAEATVSSGKVRSLKSEQRTNEAKEPAATPKGGNIADPTVPKPSGGTEMLSETANSNSLCVAESNSEPQIDETPPKMTSLECLLYELSVPMTSTSDGDEVVLNISRNPVNGEIAGPLGVSNSVETPVVDIMKSVEAVARNTGDPILQVATLHRQTSEKQNDTLVAPPESDLGASSNAALSNQENQAAVPALSQSIVPAVVWKDQTQPSQSIVPVSQTSQSIVPVSQTSNAAPYPRDESKSSSRKELPEELFTSNFGSFTPPGAPGWQMRTPPGTGYPFLFQPPPMSAASFTHRPTSRNPFDIGDEPFQAHSPSIFPSIQSLPNGSTPTDLASHPFPYASTVNMPPAVPVVPLANGMQSTRPQGVPNPVSSSYIAFPYLNPIQQPKGGNPF